ncbi:MULTISPECIES: hypothetical protein [Thermogemmatispora]|nr:MULTISPECIES: hypothetical protein [Thermogemmatispora]
MAGLRRPGRFTWLAEAYTNGIPLKRPLMPWSSERQGRIVVAAH